MNLHLTPEALTSIQWLCATVVLTVAMRTAYQLAALLARRRRDGLWDAVAREAMASDRPVKFTPEEIHRQ